MLCLEHIFYLTDLTIRYKVGIDVYKTRFSKGTISKGSEKMHLLKSRSSFKSKDVVCDMELISYGGTGFHLLRNQRQFKSSIKPRHSFS